MDTKLTLAELDTEMVALLPSKETLHLHSNWSSIYATNSSLALTVGSLLSQANSAAVQNISVYQ